MQKPVKNTQFVYVKIYYVLFTQRALKCYSYESFDCTSIQMLMRHKLLSVLNIQAETTLAEFPRIDTTNIPVIFLWEFPPPPKKKKRRQLDSPDGKSVIHRNS